MVECNQKHVIESVTQFLEKVRNGFDGSFNIKCESGKVTMDLSLSFVLGCQEKSGREKSDLCFYHQTKTSKRTKKSPSKLRRNWLRAERYRAMKGMLQTNNENCVTSSTEEEVLVSEDIPVVNNELETVEDLSNVNVMDSIEDYASTFDDDSINEDDIAQDDDSDSDYNEGNYLIFMVFCENYVSELRTGRSSLSIRGFEKEDFEDRKRSWEEVAWASLGSTKNYFAMYSEDRVFKEFYGFQEGGGYDADLSWIDYDDLYLYSRMVHNNINCWGDNFVVIAEI